MRLERFKNFITQDECDALNSWVREGVEKKWLDKGRDVDGRFDYDLRVTTRMYGNRFDTPKIIQDLSTRIREFVGVDKFPLIHDHGKDGFVVSYIKDGGDCYEHIDPPSPLGDGSCLRCNILTQAPKVGGKLFLEGQEIDIEVGELHCYVASAHRHSVSKVQGGTPRILFMFGAYVPEGFWE